MPSLLGQVDIEVTQTLDRKPLRSRFQEVWITTIHSEHFGTQVFGYPAESSLADFGMQGSDVGLWRFNGRMSRGTQCV